MRSTGADILVVDDEADIRELVAGLLEDEGHGVRVASNSDEALAAIGLQDAPRFSVPMPFNTLLWRVVAMTPDGYVEGERSLVADRGPMRFRAYTSDVVALRAVADYDAVARLRWFNHGFMKAQERDGTLIVSDLRMGSEPDYIFNFVVAQRNSPNWREIPPQQLQWPLNAAERLSAMWTRIWNEPQPDRSP